MIEAFSIAKSRYRPPFLAVMLVSLVSGIQLYAQNLEAIGKEKPLKLNGGISLNQTFYSSSDSLSRRDPYNYYLAGNLNLSMYGWSVPLSFNYSNQKTTFTQPFNNYPRYYPAQSPGMSQRYPVQASTIITLRIRPDYPITSNQDLTGYKSSLIRLI